MSHHPYSEGARIRVFVTYAILLAAVALMPHAAHCTSRQAPKPAPTGPPTVVFMTDFGIDNDAVPICKGVMWEIDPSLRIVDLSHAVTPYSIRDGARFLYGTTPYYPAGTVFVVVIDPTVGSSRKAVVVKSKRGQYFVLPDNGLMTLVEQRDGIEGAREITNPAWMIGNAISSTFHGRDIFSPVGAHLARGEDWTQVGPEVHKLVRLDLHPAMLNEEGITGDIIALDTPFGNLISNIEAGEFLKLGYARGDRVRVQLGERDIVVPFVKTFSDVALGKPLLYVDSRGRIALAVNQGNFSLAYGIKPPVKLVIRKAN